MTSEHSFAPPILGVQQPRICLLPPAASFEVAEIGLEVVQLTSLRLDDGQTYVLRNSLATREDGKWSALEVGLVEPRQNGKGKILEAREIVGLFAVDDERLIIHSAHEQATSTEHQRRMIELIESAPDLDREVQRVRKGKGEEAIELKDGSRIQFKTRTSGGGRGFTGDLLVFDEAMELPDSFVAALGPTLAARSMTANPQLWYAGSAVDQKTMNNGIVLSRVRDRAISALEREVELV